MQTKTEKLIEQKVLRDKLSSRIDVLDRVKNIFVLPRLEVMTTKQVANYFEVGIDTIKKCYARNKAEIDEDGTAIKTISDLLNENYTRLEKSSNGSKLEYKNAVKEGQVVPFEKSQSQQGIEPPRKVMKQPKKTSLLLHFEAIYLYYCNFSQWLI